MSSRVHERLSQDVLLLGGFLVITSACIATFVPRGRVGFLVVLVAVVVLAIRGVLAGRSSPSGLAPGDPLAFALPMFAWAMSSVAFLGLIDGLSRWERVGGLVLSAGLAAVAAWGVVGRRWFGRWLAVAAIVGQVGFGIWLLTRYDVASDVVVFLAHSAQALLDGRNPYSITFPNYYTPEQTAQFYGPGVVVDGRIMYGYPYLPASLLPALPAQLLGDVRLAGITGVTVLAVLLAIRGARPRAGVVGLVLLGGPGLLWLVTMGSIEAWMVALLGFVVLAAQQRQLTLAAVLLGLLLASKQYFVVALPCLWLLRPYATRRRVLALVVPATLVSLPLVLSDFGGFWRSAVEWQFVQPFRKDSLSVLVSSVLSTGWPPAAWYGVLPLAAGLATAVFLALKAPPSVASFTAALGISLLVTVLLSKQAFFNYYYFGGAALLLAAIAPGARQPPDDEPATEPAEAAIPAVQT